MGAGFLTQIEPAAERSKTQTHVILGGTITPTCWINSVPESFSDPNEPDTDVSSPMNMIAGDHRTARSTLDYDPALHLAAVAQQVACFLRMPLQQVVEITTKNAMHVFDLARPINRYESSINYDF